MSGLGWFYGAGLLGAALSLGAASDVHAQRLGAGRAAGGQARGARIEELVQRRLGLSAAQVSRLRETTRSRAPERIALARQERALADSLRSEIAASRRDEPVISALITRLFSVRRARLDLREREQRELAAFLSPSQRAMLLGLEEQALRRAAVRSERDAATP